MQTFVTGVKIIPKKPGKFLKFTKSLFEWDKEFLYSSIFRKNFSTQVFFILRILGYLNVLGCECINVNYHLIYKYIYIVYIYKQTNLFPFFFRGKPELNQGIKIENHGLEDKYQEF